MKHARRIYHVERCAVCGAITDNPVGFIGLTKDEMRQWQLETETCDYCYEWGELGGDYPLHDISVLPGW